nr:MAG TPA: hypothetical protein [Caudoviricetes sp.]
MQTSVRYTLRFRLYFIRQPSHRLNGRKTGRAIDGLGNIHRISHTRNIKKKGIV